MDNILIRKLELSGPLEDGDKLLIERMVRTRRQVAGHTEIISEGASPTHVLLVLEGLCCRYKILESGARQIVAYIIPGDFCDVNTFILERMDYCIGTLTRSLIVEISRSSILELSGRPNIMRAFRWMTLVEKAILREWVVNIGQRDAEQRIAHLFCELHLRMQAVGLTTAGGFELPLTQTELAETVGITPVHANRMLQSLRARNLLRFKERTVEIPHVSHLRTFAGFKPDYLHLGL